MRTQKTELLMMFATREASRHKCLNRKKPSFTIVNITAVNRAAKIFATGIAIAIVVTNMVARQIPSHKNGHNVVANIHKSVANEENRN